MSTALIKIPYSFVQFEAPEGYGDCEIPEVKLPVINPTDLAFQFRLNVPFFYKFQGGVFPTMACLGTISGTTFTVTGVLVGGTILPGIPLYGNGIIEGTTIVSQTSGASGGIGVYVVSISQTVTGGAEIYNFNPAILTDITQPKILGTLAARVCIDCDSLPNNGLLNEFQWIATAAKFDVASSSVIYSFQPTGQTSEWNTIPIGACFNICIYEVECMQLGSAFVTDFGNIPGIWPFTKLGGFHQLTYCSYTTFYKIADECENYPTSLLKYTNVNDAFGFFYNYLGQLANNINYVNSVRLPMYLHSPEQIEEQESYSRSDGSTLKLSHRIWTDYLFKAYQLDKFNIRRLVIATAHDFVFITCHVEGIDYDASQGVYQQGNPAQFLRLEKVEIKWFQEEAAFLKLGWATGKLRLALAEQYVNSNCD